MLHSTIFETDWGKRKYVVHCRCLELPSRTSWWNIAGDFDEIAEKIWQKARDYGIITIKGKDFFENCERRDDLASKEYIREPCAHE